MARSTLRLEPGLTKPRESRPRASQPSFTLQVGSSYIPRIVRSKFCIESEVEDVTA